jgi:hypothetical protein
LPLAAVEQRDVKVYFQVGDGFADGGLALAQFAGSGRKRAFRGNLGERGQGFKRVAQGLSGIPMDSIFIVTEMSWKIASILTNRPQAGHASHSHTYPKNASHQNAQRAFFSRLLV